MTAPSFSDSRFIRFVVVGAINAALSYAIFLVLNRFLHHLIAYSIGYAAGILTSYFLNLKYVLDVPYSANSFVKFPLVYVVQYAYGAVVLTVLVDGIGVPGGVAMLLVIASGAVISFVLMTRLIPPAQPATPTLRGRR
jgi:putative flippase GtrA